MSEIVINEQSDNLVLKKIKNRRKIRHEKMSTVILLYFILIFWSFITIFPFYYMMVGGTRSSAEVFSYPPTLTFNFQTLIPQVINNYTKLLSLIPFWRNMWNSFYISSMQTILTIIVCTLGAYGFAIYSFKGKNALFLLMLMTMMIPQTVNIIPYFSMMKFFGWINTPRAVYLPTIADAFGIILVKQYIESGVPRDLVDSARIDGCSEFGIYRRIVLPLCRPVIASLSMITFLKAWNNYFYPLVVLTGVKTMTVPIAIYSIRSFQNVDWGVILLGASISVLPFIFVFIFFSKWIIAGLTEGAIKG